MTQITRRLYEGDETVTHVYIVLRSESSKLDQIHQGCIGLSAHFKFITYKSLKSGMFKINLLPILWIILAESLEEAQ